MPRYEREQVGPASMWDGIPAEYFRTVIGAGERQQPSSCIDALAAARAAGRARLGRRKN